MKRIAVCLKPVIPSDNVRIGSDGQLDMKGTSYIVSPLDKFALEEALILKERFEAKVTAISLGPLESRDILREAIAAGVDDATHIVDSALEKSQSSVATCRALAQLLKAEKFDLVLTGVQSSDEGSGFVGTCLAHNLGTNLLTMISEIVGVQDTIVRCKKRLDNGDVATVDANLPLVMTVQGGKHLPRYVSTLKMIQARNKRIQTRSLEDFGVKNESASQTTAKVIAFYNPTKVKKTEMLEGSVEEISSKLISKLIEERIIC